MRACRSTRPLTALGRSAEAQEKFVFGGLLPLTGAASLFGPA